MRTLFYLAFAIEDCVDFAVIERTGDARPDLSQPLFKATWNIEGADYYASIRSGILHCFNGLYEFLLARYSRENIFEAFSKIPRVVVSCCGVIENNKTLKQLTLWNWPTFSQVVWCHNNVLKYGFDFQLEIVSALLEIAAKHKNIDLYNYVLSDRLMLMKRVFVINDVAACAAAEYYIRTDLHNRRSFTFIKAHNGVNAGTVTEGHDRGSIFNAELGHIGTPMHNWDQTNKFYGVCPYHRDCIEGMVSPISFWRRSKIGGPGNVWAEITGFDPDKDLYGNVDRFIDLVLDFNDNNVKKNALTSDVISFYLGHIVNVVLLSPNSPNEIILNGRLVTPPVLDLLRNNVRRSLQGYPRRSSFSKEEVLNRIRMSEHKHSTKLELRGALVVALKDTPGIVELRLRDI